uniref:NAD-specific glutamate dehydrogenase n=1 Tax=Parastrongyloides trichosuri TaxID=131310 RepID=A0A0N5A0Y1_PARTI
MSGLKTSPDSSKSREATHLQQGRHVWVAAAELAIGVAAIRGVARRQHDRLEAAGDVRIEDVARLLEVGPGVGVHRLRPQVGVVAGRIGVRGEQVIELRQAVPHHDLPGHAQTRQRGLFEAVDIGRRRRLGVQVHVDQGRGQIADRGVALIEGRGGLDLVHQRLRHGLARFDVLHVAVEDGPGQHPVFMHLRRIFHEVARRVAERRIGHHRREVVQGVAELVEQGLGVVQRDQQGLAFGRLDEVVVVRSQDRLGAGQLRERAIGGHPGARTLARTGEVVGVEQADQLAGGLVRDLIGGHVRLEGRDGPLGQRLEDEAVQAFGHVEGGRAHGVQFEVGLQLVLIEVVLRLTHLLGVVEIVPRLDVVTGDRLHVGDFLGDAGLGRGPDALHQVHRRGRGLGHRVLHAPFGVVAEAQQLGALLTQGDDTGDGRLGVVGVAVVAALDELAPDLFAQGAVVGEGQEGIDAGAGVDDGPALDVARTRGGGGGGLVGVRQALQPGLISDDGPGVLVGHDLLAEAGEGVRQIGVDAAQLGLARGVQGGAVAHEGVAAALGQTLLLGVQACGVSAVGHGLDAGEQLLVEGDLVRGGRQDRRQLGFQHVPLLAADVRGHDAEHVHGAVQRLARHLHRRHGVGEGRGFGVVRDGGDVGALQFDAFQDGFAHLGRRHLVPRRHAFIRTGPGLQQFGARRGRRQDGAGDPGLIGGRQGGDGAAHRVLHGPGRSAARQGEEARASDEKMASVHPGLPTIAVLDILRRRVRERPINPV